MRMHTICGVYIFWIEALNHSISILVRCQGNQPDQLAAQTSHLTLKHQFSSKYPCFHNTKKVNLFPTKTLPKYHQKYKTLELQARRAETISIGLIFNIHFVRRQFITRQNSKFQFVSHPSLLAQPFRVIQNNLVESFQVIDPHTHNCGGRFQSRDRSSTSM